MDSFEVENFRSLKHLKLEKLARVNLLVGKNNSGKTSVLEALFALVGIESTQWLSIIEKERGLDSDKDFRYLFYGFNIENKVRIIASQRGVANNPTSKLEALLSIRNRAYIKERENDIRNSKSVLMRRSTATVLSVSITSPATKKPIVINIGREEGEQEFSVDTSEKISLTDGLRFSGSARYVGSEILSTTVDKQTLSRKIEDIKFNKSDQQLIDLLHVIDSRIDAISLNASGQIYLDLGKAFRTLLPFSLMGEGIQRLLDIMSAIAYNAGGIVLIDEIDNGLHYSTLRVLWRGILKAARDYDVQVFATTHSAEALRHLTWVLDDDCKEYREDVAAYTLIRADDDAVRTYRHDYEQLDYALDHGVEIRN